MNWKGKLDTFLLELLWTVGVEHPNYERLGVGIELAKKEYTQATQYIEYKTVTFKHVKTGREVVIRTGRGDDWVEWRK